MSRPTKKQTLRITPQAIIIFMLAAFFYFYDFLIQVSPSVIAGHLMRHFNITATLLGCMVGLFYYTYTLFQIPAGLLLDRFGARKVLLNAIFFNTVGLLIFSFAPNIYFIGLARLIIGAASAFAFLSALFLILRWFPLRYFAFFAGLTQMLGSFGAIGGTAFLAKLIKTIGVQSAMLTFTGIGAVLFILVFFYLQNSPQKETRSTHSSMHFIARLKIVLFKRQTWSIGLYSFAIWAPIAAFAALWGVPFLKATYHYDSIVAASSISVLWLGVAIGSPIIGGVSQKVMRRRMPLMISALIGVISMTTLVYINHQPYWLVCLWLFLIGIAASGQSLSFALISDNQRLENTSAANGFNNMMIVFGGALFQPLIGKLLDLHWNHRIIHGTPVYSAHNYHIALWILPACFLMAFLASTFLIRETHCQPAEHRLEHPAAIP
jgi:MFS family permease